MVVHLEAVVERLKASLFFVPLAFVAGAVALGLVMVQVDQWLVESPRAVPFVLTSTVDSARAVLGTIASATITVAGIAFSIALLVIQLASSQYSPRIVHGLLRDPFSKRVMGIVAGTFTYCLFVLRAVRGPLEEDGTPVIPNLSVALALALGVLSILSIIAFIDHSAHSMDVSRLLSGATGEGVENVRRLWTEPGPRLPQPVAVDPPDDHVLVRHRSSGWIQHIDIHGIARTAPEGGTVVLHTEVGRYAVVGTPLCTVWPVPEDVEAAHARAAAAVVTGSSRTADQDVGYAVRQLADVSLRALSPGVNDPTTAQDALFHSASVVGELLTRQPPPLATAMDGSRVLLRPERMTHRGVVELAFEEVRLAAAGMPKVLIYLLEVLHVIDQRVVAADVDGDEARAALAEQAGLILADARRADLLDADLARVEEAHERRFGTPA